MAQDRRPDDNHQPPPSVANNFVIRVKEALASPRTISFWVIILAFILGIMGYGLALFSWWFGGSGIFDSPGVDALSPDVVITTPRNNEAFIPPENSIVDPTLSTRPDSSDVNNNNVVIGGVSNPIRQPENAPTFYGSSAVPGGGGQSHTFSSADVSDHNSISAHYVNDLPLIFCLSASLFCIANVLLYRSGELLRYISDVKRNLETSRSTDVLRNTTASNDANVQIEHVEENADSAGGHDFLRHDQNWVILFYVLILSFICINRILKFGPAFPKDVLWYFFIGFIVHADRLAPFLLVLAVAPTTVATINFIFGASILSKMKGVAEAPSPSTAIFGAIISMMSLMGSLAGVAQLLIEHPLKLPWGGG